MRNRSALHWTLPVALLCSCSSELPSHNSSTGSAAVDAPALLRSGYGTMPDGMYNGGVRSILEDSKGNYWFGSWMEGVCRFDGESLTYFTEEDGLSHNQVRSISVAPSSTCSIGTRCQSPPRLAA